VLLRFDRVSDCTIVIPTKDRGALLERAVESALAQTMAGTRVIVVDDGSETPVTLPSDPRLSLVRHPRSRGVSAARNLGLSLAETPFVMFLDDDDRIRPELVERSLQELGATDAPPPVAVTSALAVVDEHGDVREVRVPPRLRSRGDHYSLEPIEPGRSYFAKQTLVVPREVLLGIGGWDERFRSRTGTDLFWRLNPVCSIVGLDDVTYELTSHTGARLSGNKRLRQSSFRQLVSTHRDALRAHRDGYAELVAQHARNSLEAGQPAAALRAALQHARLAPRRTVSELRRVVSDRG
jgi:glycosyltransferase involved in cell wall biosynthesis